MKKETLVNRYLDYLDLDQMHQEGFGSTIGSAAGVVVNKTAKAVYHSGKAVGKTAAKAVYYGGKAAGKGTYQFGKGFVKGIKNKKKIAATKKASPYNVAKSYFKKPLNKMRK